MWTAKNGARRIILLFRLAHELSSALRRSPVPCGHATVSMNAQHFLFRQRLLVSVVSAVAKEGPSVPIADHHLAQILPAGSAHRHRPPIPVDILPLTDDIATGNQGLKVCSREASRRPSICAILLSLWGVDTPEAVNNTIQLQRIAIRYGLRQRLPRTGRNPDQSQYCQKSSKSHLPQPYQVASPHRNRRESSTSRSLRRVHRVQKATELGWSPENARPLAQCLPQFQNAACTSPPKSYQDAMHPT